MKLELTDEMVRKAHAASPIEYAAEFDENATRKMLEAALSAAEPQCCMCGKKGLSTTEGDGGTECELSDGRWVCSAECWDRAVEPTPSVAVKALQDAAHDAAVALTAVLETPEDKDRQRHARHYLDVLRSALSAQVQDVAPTTSPVEALAEMLDALENARELLEYGGFDLEKIDRAISSGRATASVVTTPAYRSEDLGDLEIHLQVLIAEKPTWAQLAAIDDHTRMWFVSELISYASGRIPLLEIEALVSRHIPAAKGGEA